MQRGSSHPCPSSHLMERQVVNCVSDVAGALTRQPRCCKRRQRTGRMVTKLAPVAGVDRPPGKLCYAFTDASLKEAVVAASSSRAHTGTTSFMYPVSTS